MDMRMHPKKRLYGYETITWNGWLGGNKASGKSRYWDICGIPQLMTMYSRTSVAVRRCQLSCRWVIGTAYVSFEPPETVEVVVVGAILPLRSAERAQPRRCLRSAGQTRCAMSFWYRAHG